jgi:hypothetical protein
MLSSGDSTGMKEGHRGCRGQTGQPLSSVEGPGTDPPARLVGCKVGIWSWQGLPPLVASEMVGL